KRGVDLAGEREIVVFSFVAEALAVEREKLVSLEGDDACLLAQVQTQDERSIDAGHVAVPLVEVRLTRRGGGHPSGVCVDRLAVGAELRKDDAFVAAVVRFEIRMSTRLVAHLEVACHGEEPAALRRGAARSYDRSAGVGATQQLGAEPVGAYRRGG